MTAALRTTVTLAVLALLVVVGVTWGFHQATKPFPKKVDPPICVDTDYAAGDQLTPADVTVNVLNAGQRDGLASRTMELLKAQGFAAGVIENAPTDTQVDTAEIWTSSRKNPAIRVLKSYVGKVTVRERTDLPYLGLNLIVGDQFGDLAAGRPSTTLRQAATVCSPPAS